MRDRSGNRIKIVDEIKKETPGQSVHLSIDSRLQYIMYRALAAKGVEVQARSATAVAMDVRTGEVLAMTSWPSYNPNDISERGISELMRNRAVADMFEPGSTMKPLTIAAALETGMYTVNSLINTNPGTLRLGSFTIRDHNNLGVIPIGDVIVKSSNVGSARITQALPKETIPNFFKKVGFGHKTDFGFPSETSGLLPTADKRSKAEIATMSYGYGLTVSLIQLASSYATLANKGIFHPPTLLKIVQPEAGLQVIKPEIAQAVTQMMEGVVSSRGTAVQAAIEGYRVGGKTGTARKIVNGKYSRTEYRSLFVGVAPLSDPRIVMAIVVENPKGSYYGGAVAAPIFATVTQEALRLMNVPLDKPFEVAYDSTNSR